MGLLDNLLIRSELRRGIVDRIKYDGPPDVLAWKYPYEDIRLGAQIIVNDSQVAVLVREGRAIAGLKPGRHTLSTANLPILATLVSAPFGGQTPFTAEVWYFNKAVNLDVKFGTQTPMQIHEPRYDVILPVRAHGQMGLRLGDVRRFLKDFVGTQSQRTTDDVYASFRGLVITKLKTLIAETIVTKKVSVFDIGTMLEELSRRCQDTLAEEFSRFGLNVDTFYITDISFPDDDPIVQRLRGAVMDRSQFDILGDGRYAAKRSFDVMEKAAQTPGEAGGLLSAGLGIGLGATLASQAANLGKMLGVQPDERTSAPQATSTAQTTADRLKNLKALFDQGLITQDDYEKKKQSILAEL